MSLCELQLRDGLLFDFGVKGHAVVEDVTPRQVWKVPGNKVAWTMYRWSSMYLAFIFLALMIDAVV